MTTAFERAVSFFPAPAVTIETAAGVVKAGGFCVASHDPPVVAVTLAGAAAGMKGGLTVAASGASLHCAIRETKVVGDRIMLFAEVERIEIRGGEPAVLWRRGSFGLRLRYPFLESVGALETFVTAWRIGELANREWTHAAHVATTAYYAYDSAEEQVYDAMKRGILHFNACVGVVSGPDSGYHETLTRFWSQIISRSVHEAKPESRLAAAVHAVQLFGEDRDLPFLFYSFNVVRDRRARREWVAPDRQPPAEWCGTWAGSSHC